VPQRLVVLKAHNHLKELARPRIELAAQSLVHKAGTPPLGIGFLLYVG
jgi:hypothetical protein